jgi:OFA family oxalate/formate antiporter-like MFS transporter
MFVAFLMENIAILALSRFGTSPLAFAVLTGVVFFAWGEIYSLFPALTSDVFGARNAAGNYGLIFTAKGTASLLVPLGNLIAVWSGGWHAVFWLVVRDGYRRRLRGPPGDEADAGPRGYGCSR